MVSFLTGNRSRKLSHTFLLLIKFDERNLSFEAIILVRAERLEFILIGGICDGRSKNRLDLSWSTEVISGNYPFFSFTMSCAFQANSRFYISQMSDIKEIYVKVKDNVFPVQTLI